MLIPVTIKFLVTLSLTIFFSGLWTKYLFCRWYLTSFCKKNSHTVEKVSYILYKSTHKQNSELFVALLLDRSAKVPFISFLSFFVGHNLDWCEYRFVFEMRKYSTYSACLCHSTALLRTHEFLLTLKNSVKFC